MRHRRASRRKSTIARGCVKPIGAGLLKEPEARTDVIPSAARAAPRVTLCVPTDDGCERRIPCRRTVTLIGARAGCKIRLKQGGVSPIHAAILNTGTEVVAIDLGSSTGTLLNGLRLHQDKLVHDDTLTVGQWTFRVEIRPAEDPHIDDTHLVALDPTPQAVALEHLATGKHMRPTRAVCLIGRRGGCDITITDTLVSRRHALFFHHGGHPAVLDLLTENGTYVNDTRVVFHVLEDGDRITFGETTFRVRTLMSHALRNGNAKANGNGNGRLNGNGNGLLVAPSPHLSPPPEVGDMIDIQATEGSQRWKIAENFDKIAKKA